MVRSLFVGPETLSTADGEEFERREERRSVNGNQQAVSGSLQWKLPRQRILSAKGSLTRLDLSQPQESFSEAVTQRGFTGVNRATFGLTTTSARVDTDYSLPALGGTLKIIGLMTRQRNQAATRVTLTEQQAGPLSDQRFRESSVSTEGIGRLEQTWDANEKGSWQLALEGAWNVLDLQTKFDIADPLNPSQLLNSVAADTKITEQRGEVSLAHRRSLTDVIDLQFSVGGETSTLEQRGVTRRFDRPKGFVSINMTPTRNWTLAMRASREVGQINFRDFAAAVSLIEEITREDNPELVPQQSWLVTLRAERRFAASHIASLQIGHERITDLVGRIPLGEDGDAIGNIPNAKRNQLTATLSFAGAPFGLPGAQLDLRGSWQRSSVVDPIDGLEREIGLLRTKDIRAELRHDIPASRWSYGFVLQKLNLAPFYQSTLIRFQETPPGGFSPGQNSIFVENKDWLGFRVRATLSEVIGQTSRFTRVIHAGRRDITPVDRIEQRNRELGGPFLTLSFGKTF